MRILSKICFASKFPLECPDGEKKWILWNKSRAIEKCGITNIFQVVQSVYLLRVTWGNTGFVFWFFVLRFGAKIIDQKKNDGPRGGPTGESLTHFSPMQIPPKLFANHMKTRSKPAQGSEVGLHRVRCN